MTGVIVATYLLLCGLGIGFIEACWADTYFCDSLCVYPKDIYNQTNMNMIFCTILWLLLGVVSPFMFLWKILYWLAHLGRR